MDIASSMMLIILLFVVYLSSATWMGGRKLIKYENKIYLADSSLQLRLLPDDYTRAMITKLLPCTNGSFSTPQPYRYLARNEPIILSPIPSLLLDRKSPYDQHRMVLNQLVEILEPSSQYLLSQRNISGPYNGAGIFFHGHALFAYRTPVNTPIQGTMVHFTWMSDDVTWSAMDMKRSLYHFSPLTNISRQVLQMPEISAHNKEDPRWLIFHDNDASSSASSSAKLLLTACVRPPNKWRYVRRQAYWIFTLSSSANNDPILQVSEGVFMDYQPGLPKQYYSDDQKNWMPMDISPLHLPLREQYNNNVSNFNYYNVSKKGSSTSEYFQFAYVESLHPLRILTISDTYYESSPSSSKRKQNLRAAFLDITHFHNFDPFPPTSTSTTTTATSQPDKANSVNVTLPWLGDKYGDYLKGGTQFLYLPSPHNFYLGFFHTTGRIPPHSRSGIETYYMGAVTMRCHHGKTNNSSNSSSIGSSQPRRQTPNKRSAISQSSSQKSHEAGPANQQLCWLDTMSYLPLLTDELFSKNYAPWTREREMDYAMWPASILYSTRKKRAEGEGEEEIITLFFGHQDRGTLVWEISLEKLLQTVRQVKYE